jgi:uncharacterized protein YndB with AHSA1/START domain
MTLTIKRKGDREIAVTRTFDAPRELVFEAYTQPERLKRWLGVWGGWELAVCEMDLRVGGSYRWVWRDSTTGTEMGVRGVFREVVPPARLVCTERFDDAWYEGEALVTVEFIERAERTTFVMTLRYGSTATRDSVQHSPMAGGLARSYDKLAELLEVSRRT